MVYGLIFQKIKEHWEKNGKREIKILDLGAGSCHNIYHLARYAQENNIECKLYGSDWSDTTSSIIDRLKKNTTTEIDFIHVDYYDKSSWEKINKIEPDIVYSIASLEQYPGDIYPLLTSLMTCGIIRYISNNFESLGNHSPLDQQSKNYSRTKLPKWFPWEFVYCR